MTAEALTSTIAANTVGLQVGAPATAIESEALRLRKAGASVIVVTAHAGGRCRDFSDPTDVSSCDLSSEIVRAARALARGTVDVIVAGHTHSAIGHELAGVAITEAYSGGRAFGRVDLVVERATGKILERHIFAPRDLCAHVDPGTTACGPESGSGTRAPAEYEGAPVKPDAMIANILAPAVKAAADQKARPLGVTLVTPVRINAGAGDSPLGNLFADALLGAVRGADVALNNTSGGIRANLPVGPLTYGAVFEAMPFDNRVVALKVSGADLRKMLGLIVTGSSPLPGLGGLRARVTCAGSAQTMTLLRSTGTPVGDDEQLVVATSDFLATGGSNIFTPITPPGGFRTEEDYGAVRDAVIGELQKRGPILREEQLVDPSNPRWTLPGQQPVRCGR
jgi:5'-nucleotidase